MRRRDAVKLIPFTFTALGGAARAVLPPRPGVPVVQPPRPGMPAAMPPAPGPCRGVPPAPMAYSRRVADMLRRVRETESANILEASYAIARAVMEGRTVWSAWDLGHTNSSDLFPGRPGMPELLIPGYETDKVRDGDVVLANFPWPPGYIEDLGKHDLFVVGGPCPWGGDVPGAENMTPNIREMRIRPQADLWIETGVDYLGAQVCIPGSASPLGPESGPLNGTIFWMMVADACRIMAREGRSVTVRGDGPPLAKDGVTWEDLDRPLMDRYFDTVLRQLELIGAEYGAIADMAGMAVDSLLAGGSVYFYSRYGDSLAGEATGRRGGFAFAKGLSDGRMQGRKGDCVIMGTYAPDDERDLANLAEMKKRGMRVASIGPVTRDGATPDGPAVYKETAAHAGRMCDTNGLFTVSGFERKVCPTSGVLVTAILWDMSVELAMEIGRRTGGDVPGINFNGALVWGAEYNGTVRAIAQQRGY